MRQSEKAMKVSFLVNDVGLSAKKFLDWEKSLIFECFLERLEKISINFKTSTNKFELNFY